MDHPDLPALDEKFELLGKLGEGGMGSVYKVRHRLLNQILVVKMMTPKSAASPEHQKRFLREAQTATRLRHPGIVSILDFVLREDGSAYMVMEYLEGANLADAVRRCGRMPASLGLFIADHVLAALSFMHEKGAIHRDIAPDNIMLTREESGLVRAKLIDLGIAKILDAGEELTVMNQFIGKVRYASPEQVASRDATGTIDGRSDIYSLGTVAYELLTGVKAFRGDNILELLHAHQVGRIVPFEESDPEGELSPELREVLLRAMAVNPDDRFASAAEFRLALSPLLPGSPLADAAARSYIQAVLALSPDDTLTVEGRPRSESGLSPGGIRTRPTTGAARPTSGGVRGTTLPTAPVREDERPARTPPPPRIPSSTSAPTAPYSKEGPSLREAPPPPGDVTTREERPLKSKTEREIEAVPAPPAVEARRRPRLAMLAFPAAALIVAGIVWFLWVGRPREQKQRADEPPVRSPLPAVMTPAPTPITAALPSPPAPLVTAVSAVESRPTATSIPFVPARPRPTLVAQALKIPTAERPAAPPPPGDRPVAGQIRFCPLVDATYYQQGIVKERPKGFAAESSEFFRRARDDAGRIQIRLSVTPKEPAQGDSFLIVGDIVNGGDLGLVLEHVEESSVAAAGGFQPVAGLALPLEIPSGGAARVYTYRGVVSGRSPFSKELRVVDSRQDAWKTAIRFRPCPEP
jgi:serine/threonine-protein kinase